MLPEGVSLPGPETGLLSNIWKWIIWGDTCAVKARDFIGKRQPGGEQQGRGAQENSSPTLSQSPVLREGLSFPVVFSQSFWVGVLPGGARLVQPRWTPEGRILGGGWMSGVSFWPFLNSSGWWWLISSVLFIRTSCRKTAHAGGYCGAWPGWATSVNVLALTGLCAPTVGDVGLIPLWGMWV